MMRSRLPFVLLTVATVLGVTTWLVLSEQKENGAADAPSRDGSERRDEEAPAPAPPEVFSPEAVTLPLKAPSRSKTPAGAAPAEQKDPALALLARAASGAMAQAGPLMAEFGDVEAFLRGTRRPWMLREISPALLAKVLEYLEHESPEVRLQAALVLSVVQLDPSELPAIRERLDRELAEMRGPAEKNVVLALTFALHTHGDAHGVRRLEDALRNGEGTEVLDFRNGAAFVLALAADDGSSPVLRNLLATDPDRIVRKHAAVGLGRIGGEENRSALGSTLATETDVEVRAWAALAAGRAAPEGAPVDPALMQALAGDPAGEVRGASAFAISKSSDPSVGATLKEAFYRDDHDLAKVGAVAGITRLPENPADAEFLASEGVPFLMEAARSSDESVSRHYAVRVLSELGPVEGRAETFREVAASDGSDWVRRTALDALAATEGPAAVPFLEERLAVESGQNRDHIESLIRRLVPAPLEPAEEK